MRGGAGFGFSIKAYEDDNYWTEFIFEWVFYFTIMLIMVNIINGIIVDTFQGEREKTNKIKEVKMNSCYICSFKKAKFEAQGVDFKHHIRNEHNIFNYYQYLLKVDKIQNPEDLNFSEYCIKKSLEKGETDFFPDNKSVSLRAY
jgi:ryanodine receptor 2